MEPAEDDDRLGDADGVAPGQDDPQDASGAADPDLPAAINHLLLDYITILYSLNAPEEGLACTQHLCHGDAPNTIYRCTDCFGPRHIFCAPCLLRGHTHMPFHRVQQWTGEFFKDIQLSDLGHVIYLGHPDGRPCPRFSIGPPELHPLKVMHTNGIHSIKVSYCECEGIPLHEQLLMHSIFPATDKKPATGFTFATLDQFLRANLISKTSAWDYCINMRHSTDPVQPHEAPV